MDWPTIELNASNQRTKAVVERVAGEAAKSGTFTGGSADRRLVIMDEADNLHGNVDRGGSRAITELVKEAGQPMVLIANVFYEMSKTLRNACVTIEFRDASARSILPVLCDICRRKGVEYEDSALDTIAETNSGDLRGAVNDLQALAESAEKLTADDVVTGNCDRTTGIFDFLDALIKEEDAEGTLRASYDVDETPDDLINWIEDNVPNDFSGTELADTYDNLANADRWLGRVRATQNYSYWRYAGDAMIAGVAASRWESKGGWTRYGPPSYWSKLGRSRATRDKRDYVTRKIAATSGTSMASAGREIMPLLSTMTHHCTNWDLTVAMAARHNLNAEHVAFITGSGEDTNEVQSIVEDAARLGEEAAVEGSDGAFKGATRTTEDESVDSDDEPAVNTETDGESGSESADDTQSGLGDFS